jgi:hypothetical protein
MNIIGGSAARRYALCSFFGAFLTGAAIVAAPQLAQADDRAAHGVLPTGAFRLADDAAPPAVAPPPSAPVAAPPASPPAAAAATPEKTTQENLFWESAQKSNTVADYKAYLESFPNGVYAPLAKNRIAAAAAPDGGQARSLAPDAGQPATDPSQPTGPTQANAPQQENDQMAPAGAQPAAPSAISPDALKAEVGTAETEQALNINQRDAMVLQRRLSAIGLYSGPIDGDLGPGSRAAIVAWQQNHGVAPTGQLGPLQLAALQAESAPVNGQRLGGQGCPPGFHPGPYGRRCWANR